MKQNKEEIINDLKSRKRISISMIQKKYKAGFKLALEIYKELKTI